MTKRQQTTFLLSLAAMAAVNPLPSQGAPAVAHGKSAMAAAAAADPDARALSAMERNYFQKTFDADPPEKRLQRLELFLTRQSQGGTVSERLALLRQVAAQRRNASEKSVSNAGATAGSNADLGRLELLILKKKFPNLDQNARLMALEKKVFGAGFPAISAKERINRLKKTLGVGESDVAQMPPGMAPGMIPGMPPGFRTYQFHQEFGSGNPGSLSPFGSPFGSGDDDMNRQMADVFNQLNQQLRQLHQMPPGVYGSPRGQAMPRFTDPYNGNEGQVPPGLNGIPSAPQPNKNSSDQRLPPYMDPNSI